MTTMTTGSRVAGACLATLLGALALGCAHTRVFQENGCWVKAHENRWGDTTEAVTVCEPKELAHSNDPLVRSVETCLYHAQMGWYTDSIERLRITDKAPTSFDWKAATAECLTSAQRDALAKIERLNARIADLEANARGLDKQNEDLRGALVTCAEKSPPAIAEAHSTSGSDAGSDSQSRHGETKTAKDDGDTGKPTPARPRGKPHRDAAAADPPAVRTQPASCDDCPLPKPNN